MVFNSKTEKAVQQHLWIKRLGITLHGLILKLPQMY